MRIRLFALTLLAITVMLMPTTIALADTTIYQGTAKYVNEEPVTISVIEYSAGTYVLETKTWNVSVIGAGTVTLKFQAKNNSSGPGSKAYLVKSGVTPTESTDKTITATWNHTQASIAAGETYDFVLTIQSTAATAPQNVDFGIVFTR